MAWKKVENERNYWNPKKGDSITGTMKKKIVGKFGNQCIIALDDGSEITTPAHAALQVRLDSIQPGTRVKIDCNGQDLPKVKGQQGIYLYEVFIEEAGEETV